MSGLTPTTFAEAKANFTPRKRSPLKRGNSTLLRRKPVRKKVKRVKVSTLKKKAWKQFSIYVRTIGADEYGINECCTCHARMAWKELQAGHFLPGRLNGNLFDERGCHAQCQRCNVHLRGNTVFYYKFMLAKFGQDVIDDLILQNNQTRKWLPGELQSIFEKYKALNDANPICQMAGE